jgi:antitoxin (DNA-binding transcriptional repressor) of toxin-antitoxin stability system
MKTLTVTKARQNLGHWLKLAAKGEEVGVVTGPHLLSHPE